MSTAKAKSGAHQVRHPEGPRKDRRRRARLEALARRMTPILPIHLRQNRPRYGVLPSKEKPVKSDREKAIEKFGEPVDERRVDRRRMAMTPQEVDQWLKDNGILGGDRRKGDRRQR